MYKNVISNKISIQSLIIDVQKVTQFYTVHTLNTPSTDNRQYKATLSTNKFEAPFVVSNI